MPGSVGDLLVHLILSIVIWSMPQAESYYETKEECHGRRRRCYSLVCLMYWWLLVAAQKVSDIKPLITPWYGAVVDGKTTVSTVEATITRAGCVMSGVFRAQCLP